MLTVLFATRNRARLLESVLEAYTEIESPPGGWKLVVVDNASTDQTGAVLRKHEHLLPLTAMHEARLGKNHALNAGLSAVLGDLVVLTDDDTFPRRDWLVRFRDAADAHPDFAVFGGLILPRWQTPPPSWVLAWVPLAPTFALTRAEVREGPTESHNIYGPNMLVRTRVFESGYRFNPAIGPQGADYAMGSETELVRRLLREGHAAWHVHDAVVEHFISTDQLSEGWILRRAVRFGRGQYLLNQAGQEIAPVTWWGIPRYMFRALGEHAIAVIRSWILRDLEGLFHARWQFNFARGQVIEARLLARGPRQQ